MEILELIYINVMAQDNRKEKLNVGKGELVNEAREGSSINTRGTTKARERTRNFLKLLRGMR